MKEARKRIWEIYPALTRAIKKTHDEASAITGEAMFYCHDFDHVIRVADRAMVIAEDDLVGRLAAVAALCHNADRIIQKMEKLGPFARVDDAGVTRMTMEWLGAEPVGTFSEEDYILIIDAVLTHSERNSPKDSPVVIALKDADRTVNLEADCIMRKAQYFGDRILIVDPVHLLDDPNAKFMKPGSLLKALQFDALDFMAENGVASIRLPKAREIAKRRAEFYHKFIAEAIDQREEAGLIPYPTFE